MKIPGLPLAHELVRLWSPNPDKLFGTMVLYLKGRPKRSRLQITHEWAGRAFCAEVGVRAIQDLTERFDPGSVTMNRDALMCLLVNGRGSRARRQVQTPGLLHLAVRGELTVKVPYDFSFREGDERVLVYVQPRIHAALTNQQLALLLSIMDQALPGSDFSNLGLTTALVDVGGPSTDARVYRYLRAEDLPSVEPAQLVTVLEDTIRAYDAAVKSIDWVAEGAKRAASDAAKAKREREDEEKRRPPGFL